jgi:transcriptional regulator with XRE-family HTH domain
MPLANRIKNIREAKNLTQEDLANKMEISASAYGQKERNASKITYENLLKIAKALDVTILFLLDIESNEFIEKK